MAPSYGWGSTASRLELLGGGSLKGKDSNSKEITHKVSQGSVYTRSPAIYYNCQWFKFVSNIKYLTTYYW